MAGYSGVGPSLLMTLAMKRLLVIRKKNFSFPILFLFQLTTKLQRFSQAVAVLSWGQQKVTSIIDVQDSENINPGCCLPVRWSLLPQLIEGSFP